MISKKMYFVFLLLFSPMWSCGSGSQDLNSGSANNLMTSETVVKVTGVTLNKSSTILSTGSSEQLFYSISPSYATNLRVTWSSSDSSVVTVISSGQIFGVAQGSANITATTEDGSITAVCSVTVNSSPAAVSGISLNKASLSISKSGTEQLYVNFSPTGATNRNVKWSSSNQAVAMVSDSGIVTGISGGTATITAISIDGSKTADCAVSVSNASGANDITSFSINDSGAVIEGTSITVYIPIRTGLTVLSPVFSSNGQNVSVGSSVQTSGVSTLDFSNDLVYSVTAENGTVKNYTVTVQYWEKGKTGVSDYLRTLAANNGFYVVAGDNGRILTSSDLSTWTARASGTTSNLKQLHWNGVCFVAIGSGGTIVRSTDGITWSAVTSNITGNLNYLNWNSSKCLYVAVADDGSIITSSNYGVTWIKTISNTTNALNFITWNTGSTVAQAYGASGTILTSPDAMVWTNQVSGTANNLNRCGPPVTAVGDNGTILTGGSSFTSWVVRSSGTTNNLVYCGYTNMGTSIAVGANGTIVTSSDATVWTVRNSGVSYDLNSMIIQNGVFVFGNYGTVLMSTDMSSWRKIKTSVTSNLYRCYYIGYLYVVLGSNGTIMTSEW